MTYQEFKNKYNGKYIDYDGAYGCQCWDLGQYYFTEVLNVPDSVLSGCGWIKNMILWDWKYDELLKYFDEISVYGMIEGDVVIWTGGEGGHIAIFDNWDGNKNWFFSQNPNPCQVMTIDMGGIHAFRRKGSQPQPVITPNVERDEYKDQIEVKVPELRVRTEPGLNANIIGYANIGFYNYLEISNVDNYTWYKIANGNWIASSDEWTTIYPATKNQYVNLPEWIEERNIYKIDTKEQFATLKPKKFGGLSYKLYSRDGEFGEIETIDYGRCYVKITDSTPITDTPTYEHGNY